MAGELDDKDASCGRKLTRCLMRGLYGTFRAELLELESTAWAEEHGREAGNDLFPPRWLHREGGLKQKLIGLASGRGIRATNPTNGTIPQ